DSSMRRVTSSSTFSGEAPGYSVCTTTTGKLTSGNCSTGRREYENAPSTSSAAIIMVANTGLEMLTLVNHICFSTSRLLCADVSGSGLRRVRRRARKPCGHTLPQGSEVHAHDAVASGESFQYLHATRGIGRAYLDVLALHHAVFDGVDEGLA